MQIRVLGAHNTESRDTRYVSLLVDDVLAIDAGCLTSGLSFEEQTRLIAVLLTHGHYDHVRDISALAINLYLRRRSISVYTHQAVYENLTQHFLNSQVYSEFHKKPEEQPVVSFHLQSAWQPFSIGEYNIVGLPVNHSIPTLGYQVSTSGGRSFFCSGDTGIGLSSVWSAISPDVLFIEVTSCDKWLESMKNNGHMTPTLLKQELISFKNIKGYFPRVITVHMNPLDEPLIRSELALVSSELGVSIEMAYEGMLVGL
jgi:phosphoribosyl 1,2-cyclic phosphodiesterase